MIHSVMAMVVAIVVAARVVVVVVIVVLAGGGGADCVDGEWWLSGGNGVKPYISGVHSIVHGGSPIWYFM